MHNYLTERKIKVDNLTRDDDIFQTIRMYHDASQTESNMERNGLILFVFLVFLN